MSGLLKGLAAAVGTIFGGPLGGLLALGGAGALMAKKGSGPKMLPAPVTRDAADAATAAADELAKRRGAAADMMNGTTGYEAGAATTGRLVVGS